MLLPQPDTTSLHNYMKNIFLDCGTHFGQGLSYFIRKYNMVSNWHIESYEANPVTFNQFEPQRIYKNVVYKNLAVNVYDGIVDFNIECPSDIIEKNTGMASSIIPIDEWNPQEGKLIFNESIKVNCIDFSKYIKESFSLSDFIVCKLDIEGAEFSILNKMIEDKTIEYIKHLYVEFHSDYFYDKQTMREQENLIIKTISQHTQTQLYKWY